MEAEEELQYEGEGPSLDFLSEALPAAAKETPFSPPCQGGGPDCAALEASSQDTRRRTSAGADRDAKDQPTPPLSDTPQIAASAKGGGDALNSPTQNRNGAAAAPHEARHRQRPAPEDEGAERETGAAASASVSQEAAAKPLAVQSGTAGGGGGRRQNFRVVAHIYDRNVQWQELKDFGRQAGDVKYATVFVRGGEKVGVLEYCEVEAAEKAVRCLDGARLGASRVRLSLDIPRAAGGGGSGVSGSSASQNSAASALPRGFSDATGDGSLGSERRVSRGGGDWGCLPAPSAGAKASALVESPETKPPFSRDRRAPLPVAGAPFGGGSSEADANSLRSRGGGGRSRFPDEPPPLLREARPPQVYGQPSGGFHRGGIPPPSARGLPPPRPARRRSSSAEEGPQRASFGRRGRSPLGGGRGGVEDRRECAGVTGGSGAVLREASSAMATSQQQGGRRFDADEAAPAAGAVAAGSSGGCGRDFSSAFGFGGFRGGRDRGQPAHAAAAPAALRESGRPAALPPVHAGYRGVRWQQPQPQPQPQSAGEGGEEAFFAGDRRFLHARQQRAGAGGGGPPPQLRCHFVSLQPNGEEVPRSPRPLSPSRAAGADSRAQLPAGGVAAQSHGRRSVAALKARGGGGADSAAPPPVRCRESSRDSLPREEKGRPPPRSFPVAGASSPAAPSFSRFHSPPSPPPRSPDREGLGGRSGAAGVSRHFGMGATQQRAPPPLPRRRSASPAAALSGGEVEVRRPSFHFHPSRRPPPLSAAAGGGLPPRSELVAETSPSASAAPPPPPAFAEPSRFWPRGEGRADGGLVACRRNVFLEEREQREAGSRRFEESRAPGSAEGEGPHQWRGRAQEEVASLRRRRQGGGGFDLEACEAGGSGRGWRAGEVAPPAPAVSSQSPHSNSAFEGSGAAGSALSSAKLRAPQPFPPAPPPLPPEEGGRLSRQSGIADCRARGRECGSAEDGESRGLRGFSSRAPAAFERRDVRQSSRERDSAFSSARMGAPPLASPQRSFPPRHHPDHHHPDHHLPPHHPDDPRGDYRVQQPPPLSHGGCSSERRAGARRGQGSPPREASVGGRPSAEGFAPPPPSASGFVGWAQRAGGSAGLATKSETASFGGGASSARGLGGAGREGFSPGSRRTRPRGEEASGPPSFGGGVSEHRRQQRLPPPAPPAVRGREAFEGGSAGEREEFFLHAERRRRLDEGFGPPREAFDPPFEAPFSPPHRDAGAGGGRLGGGFRR